MAHSDALLERMRTLHPKVIDLTLDRVHHLLDALGNPERALPPVIHIAGTNGKGSTLAMLRAGLEAAGQSVHTYTSPHLVKFHERIRLAGTLIDESALTKLLEECEIANNRQPITYFEITSCAAFLAFAREPADWLLLEVGLGGRLDATNVIEKPQLTIITPVSMDHERFLGDTRAKIAAEKAGILKRNTPCVVGPQDDDALEVIEAKAARLGAPVLVYGQHWHVWEERARLIFQDERGLMDLPRPRLVGAHQVYNAGIAIAALRHLGFGEDAIEAALTNAEWPARLQRLMNGPLVEAAVTAELWLDGGHNPAAGAALSETLKHLPQRPLYLICGMLNTKDVAGFLEPLKWAERLYGVSILGEDNTLSAEETVDHAMQIGLSAEPVQTILEGVKSIVSQAPYARILICGSLYLAGQVLKTEC